MNVILYIFNCLLWGMTWLAIKLQLGVVPIIWSIIYRFGISSVVFFAICFIKKYPLRFNRQQHLAMILLGLFLFSINYILFYLAMEYLISGLVAVTAASATLMNILNSRLFLKTELNFKIILGSILGLVGLIIIFYAHVHLSKNKDMFPLILGFNICLVASYVASLGNILAVHNKRVYHIPVVSMNAYSMLYGSLFMLIIAFFMKQPVMFDPSIKYCGSLLFLTLLGTVVGFQIFIFLLDQLGPERVGYIFVIIPIIALVIFSYVEAFSWSINVIIGIMLVLIGNGLVLFNKGKVTGASILQINDEKLIRT